MTIRELRKIIYEEVTRAMREEFREILSETTQFPENLTKTVRVDKPVQQETYSEGQSSYISKLLQETAQGMSRGDVRNLTTGFKEETQHFSGMPDFMSLAASKAKSILDAANKKDQERYGL